ncbi:hypothetical protein QEO77_gp53 [Arthrobacter phage Zaheer]|uniref:Uncharacterized protein n=1 Tax=Arthrobacter phage Zaheer TaxID=2836041 RepID=A0A8F3IQ53_9CAUD|nr:hypothetical protein QEO77_gp53 [Arthrobacter phage Zaheer]QWY84250.1 hypothetical protein SEA_ZAHEER_54 [Arthrobacter phage Zaheer]
MVYDDHGVQHNDVGTGAPSFWNRPTNTYPDCKCPPWRYNPRHPRPTNPDCQIHGETSTP